MTVVIKKLDALIEQARRLDPIRVVVVDAAQGLVIETLREAEAFGVIEPRLIGDAGAIERAAREHGWKLRDGWIVPAKDDPTAAALAVDLVRDGAADAVMKGNVHTDVLMRALLDKEHGLRLPGRRVGGPEFDNPAGGPGRDEIGRQRFPTLPAGLAGIGLWWSKRHA